MSTPTSTTAMREALGAKLVGQHRYVAIATYAINEDQARASTQGSAIKLEGGNIIRFAVGCDDCQKGFPECIGNPCEPDEG